MLIFFLSTLLAHLLRTPVSSMALSDLSPSISVRSSEEEGDTLCTPNPQRSEVAMVPQPVEVTRGHRFSIVCCIVSQYKGGSFQLFFHGTNKTWLLASANGTNTEPAVHTSASFSFTEADDSDQGNYTCVYEVTVGCRLFNSSQSEPLRVIVKDSWLLLLLLVGGGLLLLFLLLLTIFLAWRYHHDTTKPEDRMRYRRNEPIEDDDRDYESLDDEDKGDYINTATLGCETGSSGDEEDYVNTETLGNSKESLAEEGDYVNTETLGDGVGDYKCVESDGEDYVNVNPLSAVIY